MADLRNAAWLERRSIENKELSIALQDSLDAGESEAIALAIGVKADLLLMDERLGRLMARRLKLNVMAWQEFLLRRSIKA